MRKSGKKLFVFFLCGAFLAHTLPARIRGEAPLPRGKATSDEAAAIAPDTAASGVSTPRERPAVFAAADTTEYEFPEEEKNKRLIRDITAWAIASAIVGFFIVKVFLEGDTSSPPPTKNKGKEPPTGSVSQ